MTVYVLATVSTVLSVVLVLVLFLAGPVVQAGFVVCGRSFP
jgi:hypothetical protein